MGFASVCFFRGNIKEEKCEKAGGRVNPCRSRASAPRRGLRAPSSGEEEEADESETGSLVLLASHQQKQCQNKMQEESLGSRERKAVQSGTRGKVKGPVIFSPRKLTPPKKNIPPDGIFRSESQPDLVNNSQAWVWRQGTTAWHVPGPGARPRGMLSIAPGTEEAPHGPPGRLRRKPLDARRFVPTPWLRNRANFVPFFAFFLH